MSDNWVVEYTEYERDENGAVVYDYPRDKDGKKVEGSQRVLKTKTESKTYSTSIEAARFIQQWSREQASDNISVTFPVEDDNEPITFSNGIAIAWASSTVDVYEYTKRVKENTPKYVKRDGKTYIEVNP